MKRAKYINPQDYFIYLGRYIESAENDVNIHVGTAWTAIDRISNI